MFDKTHMRRKGEIMKKMQKTYQTINFPPLTEEQKKELQALEEMPDEDIDYSDIPEQNGEGQYFYLSSLKLPYGYIWYRYIWSVS